MEVVEPGESWENTYVNSKPLISYSMVIGAKMEKIEEALTMIIQKHNTKDFDELINNFEIEPNILCRMPDKDRHDYEFPDGIQDFVFYEGLRLARNQQSLKLVPLALTSVDSKRKFAMACKFYENIKYYLCVMKRNLEENNESIDSRDVSRLSSTYSVVSRISKDPLKEFLMKHSYEELRDGNKLFGDKQFYVPKAFVIVSEAPYFHEYKEILVDLYYQCKRNISFPYEYYFRYITYEVPKPGRGSKVSFLRPSSDKIKLVNSRRNELPTVQTNFYWDVFATTDYLSFDDNFLTVLYWFLCQVGTTVLISSEPLKLISLAEVLRTIIFPFEYDDSYMPLISETNYGYLSAPFPILIGVIAEDKEDIAQIEAMASDKSLLVFIDTDQLRVKNGYDSVISIKEFRKEYDDESSKQFSYKNFPSKPLKELKKRMKKKLKECRKDAANKEILFAAKEVYVSFFREYFLDFFVTMFKNYEKYVEKAVDNPKGTSQEGFTSAFDQDLFIRKESDKYHFFVDLFNTRAWILFLENKLFAATTEAENQIEFFDNKIREKYNKKGKKEDAKKMKKEDSKGNKDDNSISSAYQQSERMVFIIDDRIQGEFMTFSALNEKYLTYTDSNETQFENYLEFIEKKKIPQFGYLVIPEFSQKCYPRPTEFDKERLAPNLCVKDEKSKKTDRILKILDQIRTNNGPQHIMVSWILLWCLSFKYLQSIEKRVRIDELVYVLTRLFKEEHYDKANAAFLEYILLAIFEHGKLEHMDTLFGAIKECNIPLSIKMKQYYFKSVDKDQMNNQKKKNKSSRRSMAEKEERKHLEPTSFNREKERKLIESIKKSGKLRKRTFKSYGQRKNLLIEEVVSFEIPGKCPECTKISDYNQIFQTIEKCFFCGCTQFLPLYVCVGYKSDLEEFKTSLNFECTLFSEMELIQYVKHTYDTSVHENEKNSQKFDLMILREHRESVLWNCILFFQRYRLPYDFILPFEDLEQKYIYESVNEDNKVKEVFSVDDF